MAFADSAEDFEFSLRFVMGRIPSPKFRAVWRALPEMDQCVIAKAIREYLELANWRYHKGPPAQPHGNRPVEQDPFEQAIDEAITTCDGDPRATIKALLIANSYLESEIRIVQGEEPKFRGRMFPDIKVVKSS
jgi:hypothetical protein